MRLFDLHHDLPLYMSFQKDTSILADYSRIGITHFVSAVFPFRSFMLSYDTEDPLRYALRTVVQMKRIYPKYGYELNRLDDKGFLIVLEGLYGIDSIYDLEVFYDIGVRILGLCWNKDNLVCAYHGSSRDYGLTEFGEEVVKFALDRNMVVDLAHASDRTFKDVLSSCKSNLMVSHTGLRNLRNDTRNITYEMLREVARSGGIVGIAFGKLFLGDVVFGEVVDILSKLALEFPDTLSIGSDAFGVPEDQLLEGLESIHTFPKLYEALEVKVGKELAYKVFFENARSFFQRAID